MEKKSLKKIQNATNTINECEYRLKKKKTNKFHYMRYSIQGYNRDAKYLK